jgi:hypothetical protein
VAAGLDAVGATGGASGTTIDAGSAGGAGGATTTSTAIDASSAGGAGGATASTAVDASSGGGAGGATASTAVDASSGGGAGGATTASTAIDASSTGGAGGTTTASTTVDTGVDSVACDGSAMAGTWRRASDSLVMILAAKGCAISGTSDNPNYRHAIEGTYDDVARTMIGTIRRTAVSTGCVTLMQATWVLTDLQHFTMAIVGTDGLCNLATTYNEVSTFVRQ